MPATASLLTRRGSCLFRAVCGLLSPPRSPRLLSPPRPGEHPLPARARHASEMSNPEMALYLEKEHLRSAEESDYLLMQGLIRQRITNDSSDDSDHLDHLDSALCLTVAHEDGARGGRSLRRASAIDVRDLPPPTTPVPGSPAPHQQQAPAALQPQQQTTQPPPPADAAASASAPSTAPPSDAPPPTHVGPTPGSPPPHAQPMQLLSARSESKNSLIPTTETMC